jgi:hypothetical protein
MTLKDVTWRLVYDRLWLRFKVGEFWFEDALEVIFGTKKVSGKEVKYASKLLNEIEDNAYAIHTRASYDQRVRLYRVLNPEKVSNARGIYQIVHQKGREFTFEDLVKEANRAVKWNFMYIKDSAIGFWTNYYRSVDVHHISILEADLDGWIALFKLWDTQILVDDTIIHESKANAQAIHLHTDLGSREDQAAEMTNLHYQPPHYAIAESLENNDLLGALAILIRCVDTLKWKRVMEAARTYSVINRLGFCMECINKEANKELFSKKILEKIEKSVEKRTETIGKIPELGTTTYLHFQTLEKKWNVKCYQANVFTKAVEDLVR